MIPRRWLLFLLLATCHLPTALCQPNPGRLAGLVTGEVVLFAGSLYGLSKAWYKHPLRRFHTFDDSGEWFLFDKAGHAYTAYQITRVSREAYRWAGLTDRQAAWWGGVNGLTFQLPIEILDGFSPEYGFSVGDMVANVAGPTLYLSQQLTWGEVRISPKWSWHPTRLARERPEVLGRNRSEQWLKDYNGQTYWLSVNVNAFRPSPELARPFPRMLNVAVGYGIDNMLAADPAKSERLGRVPVRQFFFSPDLDLMRIPTQSDFVRGMLFVLNTLKVPAPALEVRVSRLPPKLKIKFHPIYF